jgi:hypothetical protein
MPIILTTKEVKYLEELVAAGERAAHCCAKSPRGTPRCASHDARPTLSLPVTRCPAARGLPVSRGRCHLIDRQLVGRGPVTICRRLRWAVRAAMEARIEHVVGQGLPGVRVSDRFSRGTFSTRCGEASSRQRERARVRGPAKSIIRDRTVLQPWAFFWDSSRSQQYTRAA